MGYGWLLLLAALEVSRTAAFSGCPVTLLHSRSSRSKSPSPLVAPSVARKLISTSRGAAALRCSEKGDDPDDGGSKGEKLVYRDALTEALGNFLPGGKKGGMRDANPRMDAIDWNKNKISGLSVDQMAARVDVGLRERGWFVTGEVLPELFHPDFEFKDPNVQTKGVEEYARGVNRLFNQEVSKMQVIECVVASEDSIGVKWRLEGKVNVGPGLEIKPYVVFTDLEVGQDGLIIAQEDRFSIPAWEILVLTRNPKPETPV